MATKKKVQRIPKKRASRPSIKDDGTVTVTLTFPLPVAMRAASRIMENMTTPQAIQFLSEIVRTKEGQKAERKSKRSAKGKPDSGLN